MTHCTRRRDGPWPDQTDAEHLDDLILAKKATKQSPLAALTRIIQTRRLVGTSATIRGGFRVVSFTSVPVDELRRLRVFRPHRGRWDFEPYGICVAQSWLESRGARPVRYATDDVYRSMPADDRAFFQVESSSSRGGTKIDWTVEQEWRHVGDVDLGDLPDDRAVVFVPSATDAAQLSPISPWPVHVLAPGESSE